MSIRILVLLLAPLMLFSKAEVQPNKSEKASEKELIGVAPAKNTKLLYASCGDNTFTVDYKNRTEAFYSRSLNLLSDSSLDQVFYAQTTNDFNMDANIDNSAIMSKLSMRNKSRWGVPGATARTAPATVRIANTTLGSHSHEISRQILWFREVWVDVCLNKALGVKAAGKQNFKFGSFPFDLGRGIALGSAYAVSPGLLGFYNDNIIDQYASAMLFSGDIVKNKLFYGIYLAILENNCDRMLANLAPVFAQEIGRKNNPWRGFGRINSIFASKLTWTIKNPICSDGELKTEAYAMVNNAPEQRVEFPSDAKSVLGTIGLACEYKGSNVEWGFDCAANLGHQRVRPWDRNIIEIKNVDGVLTETYSNVYSDSAKTTNAVVTSSNKTIVDASQQGIDGNGQQIGSSGLYNSDTRFRPGYINKYNGFMIVGDLASWVYKKEFKLACTLAYVTGDENPNKDLDDSLASAVDGTFDGFIGLQEIYSGKRVKSVVVLSSTSVPRPLSSPLTNRIPRRGRFASAVSGFTNLVFFGLGAEWAPKDWCAKFKFKPNVLSYWQEKATKKFDKTTKLSTNELANRFLGIEINGLFNMDLTSNLNAFVTIGLFVPGAHFRDVQGKPLNAEQIAFLEAQDKTGYTGETPPVLGTKRAIMLNWGLEYSF